MEEQNYIHCHYCNCLMDRFAQNCNHCGGPNTPEPLPWQDTILIRLRAAMITKRKSVWADRLAALMPLHFIINCYFLWQALSHHFLGNYFFTTLTTAFCFIMILIYYPGWINESPEKRQSYGMMYFLTILFQIISLNL